MASTVHLVVPGACSDELAHGVKVALQVLDAAGITPETARQGVEAWDA